MPLHYTVDWFSTYNVCSDILLTCSSHYYQLFESRSHSSNIKDYDDDEIHTVPRKEISL